MGKSKEIFQEEREVNMDVFCIMKESVFNNLESEQRQAFDFIEVRESNEYEENKKDEYYLKLYKANKKTKKDLQEYLFKKRHG